MKKNKQNWSVRRTHPGIVGLSLNRILGLTSPWLDVPQGSLHVKSSPNVLQHFSIATTGH